ncbi:alpha-2-macroglobulin-like protein 1 isoform X2 [Phyllobates terribilis]|uniref:alpha-2-macroglobulin-like protein 1 isoform X2 n=1 Tax=Phyllobates terribilis TaxID=111132 RepID=UPI003CCB2AD1
MWLLLLSLCLAIFHSSCTSSSEPHYVITTPNNFLSGTEQKLCVTFLDFKGAIEIKLELEINDENVVLLKHRIDDYQHSECFVFQFPKSWRGHHHSNVLHVSAVGENLNVSDSKKVTIYQRDIPCIIHNDKSTYKPGDIVKFHVISVDNEFKALNKKFRAVEIIDPNKNRIAQWLEVTTKQGFAEFTFHLANELAFGSYKINIPDGCEKEFKVDKYASKRFEVNISAPSEVVLTDKSFHLDVCGRYTYGKPVEGLIDLSVCAQASNDVWYYEHKSEHDNNEEDLSETNCFFLKGEKTDSKGCFSRDIDLKKFNFTTAAFNNFLRIKAKLTEGTTGHSEKASAVVYGTQSKPIEFMECKNYYVSGSPFHCKLQAKDEMGQPRVNEDITLYINEEESYNATHVKLVTDSNGIAEFTLSTSDWESRTAIRARFSSDVQDGDGEDSENFRYHFHEDVSRAMLWLSPYEPKTESSLKIQKHLKEISCNTDQTVTVEYDIHRKNLNADTDHLDFFYILVDNHGIFSYNEHKVNIKDQEKSQKLHGSFSLSFHVENFFPILEFLIFSILPNGETIARSTIFFVSPCIKNKMKLTFSEEEIRPGENVNLKITADGGALCSVRSVDKGYLLDKPHEDSYMLRIVEFLKDNFSSHPLRPEPIHDYREFDLLSVFQENFLLVFTNTGSKDLTPRMSVTKKKTKDAAKAIAKPFTRSFFPDTWLFELVPVGSDGHVELNRTTPHSITRWVTDAFCLSKNGLDSVTDVDLTTFQPYFNDLIVPSSVVQGEKFTIQALVFSYEKKCILIVASLTDSEDLITAQDKEQARCVCEGHSHSFTWDVSAVKLKTLKIHVDSGSIDVEGACNEDVRLIGKDLRTDSVEKTIEVKPKGYEEEKAKTFLIFPADNSEAIAINIDVPARLVPGSERAHIIIMGDLMTNVILNLDNLVDLPDGCGEQNLAKFTRYVSTMEYLESTEELTPETKAEAIQAMTKGYQKQLTHRVENGAYSMFHGDENIWLTAFIIKAYNGAKKFIPIDEKDIQDSVNWLQSKQLPNGCFEVVGTYYNNYLQAAAPQSIVGVEDLASRSDDVSVALPPFQDLTQRQCVGWSFGSRALSASTPLFFPCGVRKMASEGGKQLRMAGRRQKMAGNDPRWRPMAGNDSGRRETSPQAENEITCTAYVTIALLEHQAIYNGSIVENALSCLRKSVDSVKSMYTLALLAYAFTLSRDSKLRHQILEKLEQSIVKEGGYGNVETASYVVLTLLSDKITTMKNLEDSVDIIRWMVKEQNPWGGFGSSQDTTIALQAVAKYAKAIYRKKGDSTVTIHSKSGFEKIVHVNKSNSLYVQKIDLPEIPGEYSVAATGEGFVYLQSHLHCNVLPEHTEKEYFSFNVSTEPSDWTHASKKKFNVHVDVRYLGKRENTNMALIIVTMVSGYVPDSESVNKLKKNSLVERIEILAQNITIYLEKLTPETVNLDFSVEREALVENLQPATAIVLDYYDPDEHTVVEYNAPWNSGFKKIENH